MYKRIISWNDPFPINILDFLTPLPALGEIWWYWRAFVSEFRPNHKPFHRYNSPGSPRGSNYGISILIWQKKRRTEILVRFFDFLYIHVNWFFCFIRNLKNLIWIWVQLPTLPKMTNKFILNWLVTSITFMMIKMLCYWT